MQALVGLGIVAHPGHLGGRKRTAVLEIRNFAAMVASRAATPLGIGRARAGIHNLECDGRRVASVARLVVSAIVLRAHELKTLATAQIVVVVAWKIGPELRVVAAVGGGKVPPQRGGGGVLAEIRVQYAESIAQPPELGVGECVGLGAEAVETERARPAVGQPEMRRAGIVPGLIVADTMDLRPLARGARLA